MAHTKMGFSLTQSNTASALYSPKDSIAGKKVNDLDAAHRGLS